MDRYRIEVGRDHNVKPANIVGAIANEAGIDSKDMGRITINADHSLIDLPRGMPRDVFTLLKKVWVSGQQLRITRADDESRPAFLPAKRGKPAGFDKVRKKPGFKTKSAERKKVRKKKPAKA
jgi:ATP-dependent RNA helicase DeaD